MSPFLRSTLVTGGVAALLSGVTAALCGRMEGHGATRPINAISHIAWGGPPPADEGAAGENTAIGIGLHAGASVFWATFFEGVFGRAARQSRLAAWLGGAAISASAFMTDYYLVSKRFRPGYEAYLSRRSLFAVYAALAAGFAIAARLTAPTDRDPSRIQDPGLTQD
jgi:hypothetical protein